ncbi:MAG: MBL fold metallo-hydrolase, partial [Ruminococcaceae bacterium]|nr:MBL fold metallo-hydrolase [Oscillospiraceae bacterium]
MKKSIAILLSLLMIISGISVVFTLTATAETVNLLTNGDFKNVDLEANTATNWVVDGSSYNLDFEEGIAENLPEGEDFNIVTFNRNTAVASGTTYIYNRYTVKLQKNTDYKISFWVKNNGAKSFRYHMYEPYYQKPNGGYSIYAKPAEGSNIYSYDYDNGSTRLSRLDIKHIIKDVTNNKELRNGSSSMASFANTFIAPDNQGEWVKIEHTFTTGNDDYHIANIRLAFSVEAVADNTADKTLSIGGIEMTANPTNAIVATAEANNYDLGTVEPINGAMVDDDGDVTFTAVPFGSNKFLGWYKGGKLVSTNTTLTYAYNADDTEKYIAMFENYGTDISDGAEKYANNYKVVTHKNGGYDNSASNGDWALASNYDLTWQSVSVTTSKARSGSKSFSLNSRYSFAGRNFSGLKENTDYTLTFYSYMDVEHTDTSDITRQLERVFVLPQNVTVSSTSGTISSDDSRIMAKKISLCCTGRWEKTELTFNTGSNTDITLWINFAGHKDGCYIDDISLVCNAVEEDDGEEEEDTTMDFEDITKWGKGGYGSKQLEGYTGYIAPESYVTIKTNTTKPELIKEGESSIVFNPQTRWYDYKLTGLKPNTTYALSFSYATDEMKASTGSSQSAVLSKYGIFNYAAEGANLSGTVNTPSWKPSGYLHYIGTNMFTIMDDDGVGTPTYTNYSIRRVTDGGKNGIAEVANTWYNTVLYFDSGNVSDTLAFVVMGNCSNTYLDDFKFVEIKDDITSQEFYAPALEGKTATGSYDTEKAKTTLYNNVTEADFNSYKTTLANANFAEYATNAYGDNQFATYVKGNTTVNVEYTPANSTILVTEQVTDTLAQNELANTYTDKGLQPLIIQLDHNNSTGGGIGMSYIIRLADGSFIIVDGGHAETYFDNANRLYNLLREYTPEGKIQIAAWLFTHCHDDHISGFSSFIERYGAQINIEQVIYNFATYEQYVYGKSSSLVGYSGFEYFDICLKLNPDIKISTCHSGYKYHIRNAVIDVMYTLEDNFPKVLGYTLSDVNNTSTTFKISFTDENVDQTLLITGDSANEQCAGLLKKYSGNELEATFVQAIHHGISYGSYELYGKMNPEIVLFPASANRLMEVLYQNQNSYFVKEDSVKEVVCSDYGTRVFALPYTAPEGLTGMSKFTLPAELDVVANPIN